MTSRGRGTISGRAGGTAAARAESPTADASSGGRAIGRAIAAAAVAFGVVRAASLAWTSDDAYISFRYARNLADGLGLVYNAGERVEGYTNFLWTLWCALGLRLGFAAERWADVASIACYGATIALLAGAWWRKPAAGALALPLAAALLAVHHDAAVFATSGLETALFGLLGVAGFTALAGFGEAAVAAPGPRRAAVAGLALALATLTRPDGALWLAAGGAWTLARGRPRIFAAAAFAGVALAILGPWAAWKLAYYGDLMPNTYYAKSASRGWWDQGVVYARLYFRQYGVLALAVPLAAVAWVRRAPGRERAALALAFALPYVAYVIHVGGDFMYARLLVPTAPFFALALEAALPAAVPHAVASRVAAAALVAALAFAPRPFAGEGWVRGIVDERAFYTEERRRKAREVAATLERLGSGLPLRVVISGQQGIVSYRSRVPVAIEASTGLTDAYVARLPLAERGRPGHEKGAPLSYLIDRRRAHLYLGRSRILADSLSPYVPLVALDADSLQAFVLTWDPPVIDALRSRGALITPFDDNLDRFIADLDRFPDPFVAEVYAKTKRFYFEVAPDSAREAPFRRRLGLD